MTDILALALLATAAAIVAAVLPADDEQSVIYEAERIVRVAAKGAAA